MKNSKLIQGFVLSCITHAGVFFFTNFLISQMPSSSSTPTQREQKIKVTLVEEGQRVDIVGMPTHTLKELLELEKIRIAEKRVQKKRDVFLEMLKDIAKKAESSKSERPTRAVGEPKVILLAGNKISKGMSYVARKSNPDLKDFHQYLESLPQHIKTYWKLPSYLMGRDLRCRIKIIFSESGQLLSHTLIESSGDEEFDRRAMQATKDSSPFPVPDTSIVSLLRQGHIILGFPE